MGNWGARFVFAIGAVFCFARANLTPGQNPLGALRGVVVDASGARVPSATVSATSPGRSLTRENRSDARGEFLLEDLPPGSYELTVSAQ